MIDGAPNLLPQARKILRTISEFMKPVCAPYNDWLADLDRPSSAFRIALSISLTAWL
jgi:hypothetical protein